ncbi:MAG: type II toxin-antitoxin system prevent-host-death family antitoxin [Alphaproteobacteria bacterium]
MAKTKPAKRTKRAAKFHAGKLPAEPAENRARLVRWQVGEARDKLSTLIAAAMAGEPQEITRGGKSLVVVVSAKDYKVFAKSRQSLDEMFQNSPLAAAFGKGQIPELRHAEPFRDISL